MDVSLTEEEIAESRIVLVDDDDLVTSSLGSFFALELDVEPVVFNSSKEAAAYLVDHEVDLVITDFLMPQMNGIELLEQVRAHQPQVPRILLTGYADKENAIRAINEVGVFQYVEKPWENDRLKKVVLAGLTRVRALRQLAATLREMEADDPDFVVLREGLLGGVS